jgi:hypothetical protein
MPRLPSIPGYLEQKIFHRWVNGESPQQIADWIERTNVDRKKPVSTSRSSVERCLERLSRGEGSLSAAAAFRRLQCAAPALVQELENVIEAYKQQIADAAALDGSVAAKVRHQETGRDLTRLEMGLIRQLRLAGCSGRSAERLCEKADAMEREDLNASLQAKQLVKEGAAQQLAEAAAAHPDLPPEVIEDLVLGDDFAERRVESIRLERNDISASPPAPAVEAPGEAPEAGKDAGENLPVSIHESAAKQEETIRGTSGVVPVAEDESWSRARVRDALGSQLEVTRRRAA